MANHDSSIRERVIALAEEGGLSGSTAGELYGVLNYGYRNTRGMGKLQGAEERGYGAYPAQLRMLR
jgi:hypothetical protein